MIRVAAPLLAVLMATAAYAQEVEIPEITVTAPYRGIPTRIAKAGSAVTVVTAEEIEAKGARTLVDVLETVPGVQFKSSGGEGTATSVFIRGAGTGQSLVLIDGVRVGDASALDGGFDFGSFPLDSVERIEVLKGPQSALYGSDALGGVINIVTRKGEGPLRVTASAEAGSYMTHRETLSVTGEKDGVSLAAGGGLFRTSGFSRYADGSEDDHTLRFNGWGRIGWQASEDLALEAAFDASRTEAEFDAFGADSTVNVGTTDIQTGRLTATVDAFDDRWISAVTLFANRTRREMSEQWGDSSFEGTRFGAEYQGTVDLDAWGTTVFGAGFEREQIETTGFGGITDELDHAWGFAMHQFSPTERLHLSLAGRVDGYELAGTFGTVRATAAYEIFETETKLRASAGTGAKAPTPFQLYCDYVPVVEDCGNPNLRAETSIGVDVGIDQTLFDGAVTVSATGFYNRFDDMIAWLDTDGWENEGDPGRYANVASAETAGLELEGTWRAIPGKLEIGMAYTYLYTRDLEADRELLLRAPHSGSLTVTYTGIDKLRLGATVRAVGERVDFYAGDTPVRLDPFVTVDLDASYDVSETVTLTGRVVNLFDTEYEEVGGYGTSGLAAYGGLRVRW